MFIKKDLRKIPQILDEAVECVTGTLDATTDGNHDDIDVATTNGTTPPDPKRAKLQEPLTELRLGRRQQEFHGTIQILCQPQHVSKLLHLKTLNLYDCNISTIDGIGLFERTPCLEKINLGRNPLETIPDELARVQSLKHIWLDDCRLRGSLPKALLQLRNLQTLRLPNNGITDIPILDDGDDDCDASGGPLRHLQVLCLDRNQLSTMPNNLRQCTPNLKELLVRHNRLEGPLRCQLPSTLQVLHVSSNQLTSLDALVHAVMDGNGDVTSSSPPSLSSSQCPHLTHLYANGNQLTSLPNGILSLHPNLERLVVSHNPPLSHVPDEFWERCGRDVDGAENTTMAIDCPTSSSSSSSPTLEIIWQPNPSLIPP